VRRPCSLSGAPGHDHYRISVKREPARLVEDIEAYYFLYGPTRFKADLQTGLERRNVPAEHIHTESFGPMG
jgi:ferredoxin-NADP reductase